MKQAFGLIATAAEGSMRDALSLLDQAIAFSTSDTLQTALTPVIWHDPTSAN